MRRLFDGLVDVDYGQCYLYHGDNEDGADLLEAFRGQNNGLCGAAMPKLLFLKTSTHTGSVAVTIDAHESVPIVDNSWEEIVEVSFEAIGEQLDLVEMMMGSATPLPLAPGIYKVRYSARGVDMGGDANTLERGKAAMDRYHLDFWLAAPDSDVVIRQTSRCAAYGNDWVKRPDQDVA